MKKVRLFAMAMLVVCLLASNVFAADVFTPSVAAKEAPEVKAEEPIVVEGKEVEIVVTPVSKADAEETHEEVSEALVSARKDIEKVKSVAELPAEGGTVAKDLEKQLEGTDYTPGDLVVRDLFDVSLTDENGEIVKTDKPVTLTFNNVGVKKGEVLIVLHNKETGKWEVIDSSKVKINDDGSVAVTFDSLSPIAFLTTVEQTSEEPGPGGEKPAAPGEKPAAPGDKPVTSPQTGETTNVYAVCAVVMLLAAAVVCATRAKRVVC